jgi:hypothetical protein
MKKKETKKAVEQSPEDKAWEKLWEIAKLCSFGGKADIDLDAFKEEGADLFDLKYKKRYFDCKKR